jgi:hypothetical protein
MNLGVLHAALSVVIVEKGKYIIERLLWIVQDVSKCPALTILKEIATGND